MAEVRVSTVEKGEGIASGETVSVRYWTREWTWFGETPLLPAGHRGLPKEGDRLRVYIARNGYDGFSYDHDDGDNRVIGPNGFEALPAKQVR